MQKHPTAQQLEQALFNAMINEDLEGFEKLLHAERKMGGEHEMWKFARWAFKKSTVEKNEFSHYVSYVLARFCFS